MKGDTRVPIVPKGYLPADLAAKFVRVSALVFVPCSPVWSKNIRYPPALSKVFDAPFLFGPKIFGGPHSFLRPHLGCTLRPFPNLGSFRILLFLWKPKNSYLDILTEIFRVQTVWILLSLHEIFTRNYLFVYPSHWNNNCFYYKKQIKPSLFYPIDWIE